MQCREFHAHLPQLLRRGGVYSFFNGLAADNPFFYAVYLQLVPAELHALQGLTTQYIQLPIQMDEQVHCFYTCVLIRAHTCVLSHMLLQQDVSCELCVYQELCHHSSSDGVLFLAGLPKSI